MGTNIQAEPMEVPGYFDVKKYHFAQINYHLMKLEHVMANESWEEIKAFIKEVSNLNNEMKEMSCRVSFPKQNNKILKALESVFPENFSPIEITPRGNIKGKEEKIHSEVTKYEKLRTSSSEITNKQKILAEHKPKVLHNENPGNNIKKGKDKGSIKNQGRILKKELNKKFGDTMLEAEEQTNKENAMNPDNSPNKRRQEKIQLESPSKKHKSCHIDVQILSCVLENRKNEELIKNPPKDLPLQLFEQEKEGETPKNEL